MSNDSTRAVIRKVDVTDENFAGGWAGYFDACDNNDLIAAFNALVNLGMKPVPLEATPEGKIKKPIGKEWGKPSIEKRREVLRNAQRKNRDGTGLGCQPFGYVVFDLDPPDKDPARIDETLEDFREEMLCGEIVETLEVKGERGLHIWFKASEDFLKQFGGKKRQFKTPSGGHVEVFVGSEESQMQVACAPSRGKHLYQKFPPCPMPDVLTAYLTTESESKETKQKTGHKIVERKTTPSPSGSKESNWFLDTFPHILHGIRTAKSGELHFTLRNRMRSVGGYAAATGCEHFKEKVFEVARENLRENGGCESFEIAERTMEWGWNRGGKQPSLPNDWESKAEFGGQLEGTRPTSCEDIEAEIEARKWVWGDTEQRTGWFVERGLHLVEGKEGTGKTRWIMDLVRRWTNGLPWPDGSRASMDQEKQILFVAADQHWDQIATTRKEFGIPSGRVKFVGPVEDPYSCTSIDDPKTLEYIRKWCEEQPIGMVVIDTLMGATSRPLVDPQEVAQVAGPLRTLARDLGIPIVMVGHLNKDGETWGRSIGRQCDHVIRLEAEGRDDQEILIKSVKARWNRSILPTIRGRQTDTGWEYSTIGSDYGDTAQDKSKVAVMEQIVGFISSEGKKTWSELVAEMTERKFHPSTIDRGLKTLVSEGRLVVISHQYPSGKSCKFYDLDGYGVSEEN